MEDENPLETREQLEELREHAGGEGEHEGGGGEHAKSQGWVRYLSISTAIIAVLAALATLLSGNYANEALLLKNEAILKQTLASDQWSYYQAKGIKHDVAQGFQELKPSAAFAARIEKLATEQKEIQTKAQDFEKEAKERNEESETDLGHHHKLAVGVTLFQIAIALSAIAALLRRRRIWVLSLLGAAVGLFFLIAGLR